MQCRPSHAVGEIARVAILLVIVCAACPAAGKLRFLQNPVSPSIRVSLTTQSGRQVDGMMTAQAHGGFVLQPRVGAARDVQWSELEAEDFYGLQSTLIGRRSGNRSNDWFNLGRRLHERGDAQGRRYAEMAFRRAIDSQASFESRVRAYLQASRQAENSIEKNQAGSASRATASQADATDAAASIPELATPFTFRATTQAGERLAGRLVACNGQRFAYEQSSGTRHERAWVELSADDVFAMHAKMIGLKDRRRDSQASSDDWHALAAVLDGMPGAAAERKAERAREMAARLKTREDRSLEAVGIDPDRLDEEAEAMDAVAVPTSANVDPAKIPDSFTGRWEMKHEPHEIHRRLRDTFTFGVYQTDDPANFHDPRMIADREPDVWTDDNPMTFAPRGVFYDWWNLYNTTGRVLGAMGQRDTGGVTKDLQFYLRVLVEGDPEVAVPIAEAYVRLASEERLGIALELLAAAYQRSGESGKLNLLIRQGIDYRPITHRLDRSIAGLASFQDAPVRGNDLDGIFRNVRASLLRCDGAALDRWLRRANTLSLDTKQQRQLDEFYRRAVRLRDGLAASLKKQDNLALIEAALDRIVEGRRVGNSGLSLVERLDPLSTAEVLLDLQHHLRVFGANSSPVADRLLYLMEHRQWSGLELSARTLYPIAFHIHKYYEPARVVAVYALVQKAGCLRPPQNSSFGNDFFAAAECGIYLQRCFEDNEALLAREDAWTMLRPVIALGAEMCNDESASQTGLWPHMHAWNHRDMSNHALFEFDILYNRTDASAVRMREELAAMEPSFDRHYVRDRYMKHLYRNAKDYPAALEQIELMAQGIDHIGAREIGVRHLQWWAEKHGRPDIWELARRYARQAQAVARREVDHPGYRDHLIQEHQKYLNKQPSPTLSSKRAGVADRT